MPLNVDDLRSLLVFKWKMMTVAEWKMVKDRIGRKDSVDAFILELSRTPSSKWTDICGRKQMTAYLANRVLSEDPTELVINGRYVVFDTLGSGGQGETFLAFDMSDEVDPVVVVKQSKLRPGSRDFRRLENEYILLDGINSIHFPKMKYFDRANGRFIMQFLPGPTLNETIGKYIHGRRLPYKFAQKLIKNLCEGLDDIHRNHCVHRDIKPENMIFHKPAYGKPRMCIVDFGIAKEVGSSLGTMQVFLGTPYFTAPECQSNPAGAEPVADVYSMACSIFALLVGEPPFFQYSLLPGIANKRSGRDLVDRFQLHQPENRPRISHFRRNVDPQLDELIFRALEWDWDAREHKDGKNLYAAVAKLKAWDEDTNRFAPTKLQRARLVIAQAYRDSCREPPQQFSSTQHIAKVIQQIVTAQTLFEDVDVQIAVTSHPDDAAKTTRARVDAWFQGITADVEKAGDLRNLTREASGALIDALLNSVQAINVDMLKLFHILCD